MNKAFVREPDADAPALCPRCGSAGTSVGNGPVQLYVRPESRDQLLNAAWCCVNPACDVVYFTIFEQFVRASELTVPVYPYDMDAPICACFGFSYEDILADADGEQPTRIRRLLAQSESPEARCAAVAVDGQCCMKEVQRLYRKLRAN